MGVKMYACLECGFIHDGKKEIRERIDEERSANRRFGGYLFHGWITWRICPKCKHKQQLKVEKDISRQIGL